MCTNKENKSKKIRLILLLSYRKLKYVHFWFLSSIGDWSNISLDFYWFSGISKHLKLTQKDIYINTLYHLKHRYTCKDVKILWKWKRDRDKYKKKNHVNCIISFIMRFMWIIKIYAHNDKLVIYELCFIYYNQIWQKNG